MATGYTANTADGTGETTSEFLSHLARGLGLYVMMRDDGPEAELRVDTSNVEYRQRSLNESIIEYRHLTSLSEDEAEGLFRIEMEKAAQQAERSEAEQNKKRERYQRRLEEIKLLDFPEGEFFDGLRKFAIEQLEESMRFDCSIDYSKYVPAYKDAREWLDKKLELALRSIERDAAELSKAQQRTRESVKAHNDLVEFLGKVRETEDERW